MGRPRNLTALSTRKGKGSPAIASLGHTPCLFALWLPLLHICSPLPSLKPNLSSVVQHPTWFDSSLYYWKQGRCHQHTVKLAGPQRRSCWSDSLGDYIGIGWHPIVDLSQHWKWQQIGGRPGKLQSEYKMDSISIGVWILPCKDWNKDCPQCGWNEQGDDNGVKPVQ